MQTLEDAGHWYRDRQPLVPPERGAEWAPRSYWQAKVGVNFSAPTAPVSEAVEAYVNEGRWIAECPDCHGAQVTCRTDARFMCHCCGNQAVGGRWRPVVWPDEAKLRGIEVALLARPQVNQHWRPGERVADLEAENEMMRGDGHVVD